jgi:hypothetical protein
MGDVGPKHCAAVFREGPNAQINTALVRRLSRTEQENVVNLGEGGLH